MKFFFISVVFMPVRAATSMSEMPKPRIGVGEVLLTEDDIERPTVSKSEEVLMDEGSEEWRPPRGGRKVDQDQDDTSRGGASLPMMGPRRDLYMALFSCTLQGKLASRCRTTDVEKLWRFLDGFGSAVVTS